jgi:hypothetical protein
MTAASIAQTETTTFEVAALLNFPQTYPTTTSLQCRLTLTQIPWNTTSEKEEEKEEGSAARSAIKALRYGPDEAPRNRSGR